MPRAIHLVLPTCALLALCTGCPGPLDIASRGFSELKGAQAQAQEISPLDAATIANHGVELERVVSAVGPLVPPEFVIMVDSSLRKDLADLRHPAAGGAPVRVHGQITYYQPAGSIAILRGKETVAVMHVTGRAPDGRTVADFQVVATTEALRSGDMDLAQALARGTVDYFRNRLPR